jgi:murein DD-endopeptidase MepM/ murein hydrolase activator NlpD
VQTERSSLFTLCSEECLREKMRADADARARVRRRNWKRLVVVSSLVGACVTPHDGPRALHKTAAVLAQPSAPAATAPLPGSFGPDWPPTEASLLDELGRDAWLHPLAGPIRRMPARDSRVFGADRAGDRPIECRKGHCGVDLGGEIWGEQVHAAHDGIVDRVQRGANDAHGGHYVRIAHRNGTVFTQYFHLAAVASWMQVGTAVRAGDIIGLLGDTGVKESAAHLHFTVSVRPASSLPEIYVDPEPLVALWPLRIPLSGLSVGLVSTVGAPGIPLGGAPVGSRNNNKKKHVRATTKSDESEPERGAGTSGGADAEPPSESSE